MRHNDFPGAREVLETQLAQAETELGPDHIDTLTITHDLGAVCLKLGDAESSVRHLKRSLEGLKSMEGADELHVLLATEHLGRALAAQGNLAPATALIARAADGLEKLSGPNDPHRLAALVDLASVLLRTGANAKAGVVFHGAADAIVAAHGECELAAQAFEGLGAAFSAMDDNLKAAEYLALARRINEEALGPEHRSTVKVMNSLALTLFRTGDREGALELFRRTLEIDERDLGPGDPQTVFAMCGMAAALQGSGSADDAVAWLRGKLADRVRRLGPDHRATVTIRNDLAATYAASGNWRGASEMFRADSDRLANEAGLYNAAVPARKAVLGAGHPSTIDARVRLATAYAGLGNVQLAYRELHEAYKASGAMKPKDTPEALEALLNLGNALVAHGDHPERGIEVLIRSHEGHLKAYGPGHQLSLASAETLAEAMVRQGDAAGAIGILTAACKAGERILGRVHPAVIRLGEALNACQQGRPHEAPHP
ncbi:MAG: tetratricopeptide repeat protein [Deltaproteobacteria bacterium]|nr:tetratricopeptide repeat protein [Deltaproteobacteria bacterium]